MTQRVAFLLPLALACSASTHLAPAGPHPPHIQEFLAVPFPPPPAQVEELPRRHEDDRCVWVDGHYDYQAGRWAWTKGRWVVEPEDCYYAAPLLAWSRTAEPRLYYTPPRWYRDDASDLAEDKAVCPEPKACR